MSSARIIRVRNVNEALATLRDDYVNNEAMENWRRISPRGKETLEHNGTIITEYERPTERVLFSATRDANPFFHFFESLWILAGRRDVAFLKQFVSTIDQFSDDGKVFHGAYGWRLRTHFMDPAWDENSVDQIIEVITLLRNDPDTRRAVVSMWDPRYDLNRNHKDIPCNDLIMFKLRDGLLDITVCCRSNDAVWGAYGANAVQFSVLQEFVASALGVKVGVYRQVSDSFHIYTDNEAWMRLTRTVDEGGNTVPAPPIPDLYSLLPDMVPFPIMSGDAYLDWLANLNNFLGWMDNPANPLELRWPVDGFFSHVAIPMAKAWHYYKVGHKELAAGTLKRQCAAADWAYASTQWIERRIK